MALARVLLDAIGEDGFGLIALLTSSVGLVQLLEIVIRSTLIRNLAEVYHSDNDNEFLKIYNSAIGLLPIPILVVSFIFAIFYFVIPLFEIPPSLQQAAQWLIIAQAIQINAVILLSPATVMYHVTERMVQSNIWAILSRASSIIAAIIILYLEDFAADQKIIIYGFISSGIFIAVELISAVVICFLDGRLWPRLRHFCRGSIHSLITLSGLNFALQLANSLHIPLGSVLMNLWLGLTGNLMFGLSTQLAAYVRMTAQGATQGIAPVAARISSRSGKESLNIFTYHSMRLHGFFAFPAFFFIVMLADPCLTVWVGGRAGVDDKLLESTGYLVRILGVGFVVSAISEGWTNILYGAGEIRRYARILIASGILNPIFSIGLLWALPDSMKFIGPAIVFSSIFIVSYGILVPFVTAQVLGDSIKNITRPLLLPLLSALASTPVLVIFLINVNIWNLNILVGAFLLYSSSYVVLAYFFVLTKAERRLILNQLSRFFLRI